MPGTHPQYNLPPQLPKEMLDMASSDHPSFMNYYSSEFRFPPQKKSKKIELQGPRPSPLQLYGDSFKIKEPPRRPVIIYTVSPKVIHAKPEEFMAVVQRLTGKQRVESERRCNRVKSMASSQHDEGEEMIMRSKGFGQQEELVRSHLVSASMASHVESQKFLDESAESECHRDRDFVKSNFTSSSVSPHNFPSQSSVDLMSRLFDL